jgi:hypothetical protein
MLLYVKLLVVRNLETEAARTLWANRSFKHLEQSGGTEVELASCQAVCFLRGARLSTPCV